VLQLKNVNITPAPVPDLTLKKKARNLKHMIAGIGVLKKKTMGAKLFGGLKDGEGAVEASAQGVGAAAAVAPQVITPIESQRKKLMAW
jgi:hypothetical protein